MNFITASANVLWGLAAVFGVLSAATLISLGLSYLHPEKDYRELILRIRSWWIMIGLFSLALMLGGGFAVGFFGFISFLAFKEYLSLIPARQADHRVLFWAYLSIPLQYYWISQGWYGMFVVFIPVYLLLFLPMRMVTIGETAGFLKAASTIHWGLMTTVFSISHMAYLLMLPASGNPVAGGAGLVLFLVILTEGSDVSQYTFGKLFGKHKVIPKVSPNKTWEGLIGGILATTAFAYLLAPLLTPFNSAESLGAGALIGVTGFIGDVVESAMKRDLGIKDSGSLLPGHGGILDRIDSLTYTAPLFFHFVNYFHYGTNILSNLPGYTQ